MSAAARDGDVAGGAISATQGLVTTDGLALVVVGDPVAFHGGGTHVAATMAAGSAVVTIDGKAVCRVGDAATCGHTVAAGSPLVSVPA